LAGDKPAIIIANESSRLTGKSLQGNFLLQLHKKPIPALAGLAKENEKPKSSNIIPFYQNVSNKQQKPVEKKCFFITDQRK
jgi:hypothetical protein